MRHMRSLQKLHEIIGGLLFGENNELCKCHTVVVFPLYLIANNLNI